MIIKKLLKFLRRTVGTEQIRQDLEQFKHFQNLIRIEISNAFQHVLQLEKIRMSDEYQCYKKIFSYLKPMDVKDGQLVRMGQNRDGGYVMLNLPNWRAVEFAYSIGIEQDVSWDEDMAKLGVPIFMYDHTIAGLPKQHEKFNFFPFGVTGFQKKPQLKTLRELLCMNGHENCQNMILKIDVEGAEWDVFTETNPSVINQFSQITIELHDVTSLNQFDTVVKVLEKINQTHQSVHIHYNNYATPFMCGDLVLSPTVEVLFVRRSDFEFEKSSRIFPTTFDQPNNPALPDVMIKV